MKPLCPYFGKCGGCSAQHIEYKIQLENKKNLIKNATGFDSDKIKVFYDEPYYYRNRMDFIFHKKGIGFREKNKWFAIVDVEKCYIANEKINNLIKEIRDYFIDFLEIDAYDLIKKTGTFKQVVIRSVKETSVSFVLNENSTRLDKAVEKIREFSKITTADKVAITYVPSGSEVSISENFFMVKGNELLFEEFLGKKFQFSIQGFFQNNSVMAEKMVEYVNSLLKNYENEENNIKTKDSYLLDLYGGVGIFGITNSNLFKETTIIESFKGSIEAANKNIELNNLKNIKAFVLDAKQIYKANLKKPLFVITDPPRSGMEQKAIIRLKELSPEVIIYVSCNPIQLKKDLTKFKEYEIKSVAMFDLFPQTNHVEAVVEMRKKKI
ncbi:MAG: 23S rRNA (uracil(1939)-C(5))-methyltransferase RlmD [Candidatus Woesearchaeota archaeon]